MADSDVVGKIGSLVISSTGATSFFTGSILSLDETREVEVVDMTAADASVPTAHPGNIQRFGISGTMKFDPGVSPPIGVTGQVNLTWADAAGTVQRWGKGFLYQYNPSLSAISERMEADFGLYVGGTYTLNPT